MRPNPLSLLCILDDGDFESARDAFFELVGEDKNNDGESITRREANQLLEGVVASFEEQLGRAVTTGDAELPLPIEAAVMIAISLKSRKKLRGGQSKDRDHRFLKQWIIEWGRQRLSELRSMGGRRDKRIGRLSAVDQAAEEASDEARKRGLLLSPKTIASELRSKK